MILIILIIKKTADNKTFWKTIRNTGRSKKSIALVQNGQNLINIQLISETFNNFFSSAVKQLDIPQNKHFTVDTSAIVVTRCWRYGKTEKIILVLG